MSKETIKRITSALFYSLTILYSLPIMGQPQDYEASPFGFHPALVAKPGYPNNGYEDARDIGIHWNRLGPYAFWFLIQPDLDDPGYDFSMHDNMYSQVPTGIHILANITAQGNRDEGRCLPGSYLPVDSAMYVRFVKATVERYDGDGKDDCPGLAHPIRYWQVDNEPPRDKTDFARLQKMTYNAIKEACPECQVLIGGATGFYFYRLKSNNQISGVKKMLYLK